MATHPSNPCPDTADPPAPSWSRRRIVALGAALCGAALLLHLEPLLWPFLFWDDVQILAASWTWSAAQENFLEPHNEHTMPLGRISTYLLVIMASQPTALPLATALQGPLAVLLGMVLVYRFVRRELGHPVYGLLAMALFGVTTQYRQAVQWFSASFAVLALDTVLLALLAAQRWRQTGKWPALAGCAAWSALAPGWFASGILSGPLCALYLSPRPKRPGENGSTLEGWRRWLVMAVPMVGSALFMAATMPRNAGKILHTEHYGNSDALHAFDLVTGLQYTARSLADDLVIETLGFPGVACPPWLAACLLLGLTAGLAWWWVQAPHRLLMLLGLGFILLSNVMTYIARASWSYEDQMYDWSRYNLFPHMGLVLILIAGLPRWEGWLLGDGRWGPRAIGILAGLVLLLMVSQLPRNVGSLAREYHDGQQRELSQVEEMDRRCREQGISAAQAREVLGHTPLRLGSPEISRWEFLRGSDRPQPLSSSEARERLAVE